MTDRNKQIRWWLLLFVTAIALYLCWLMVKPFAGVLAWAAVLVIVFYPVHLRLVRKTQRPALSALLSCVLVILTIMVPVVLVTIAVLREFSGAAQSLQANLAAFLDPNSPLTGRLMRWLSQFADVEQLRSQEHLLGWLKGRINNDFIFNCNYKFLDRFAEEENYFAEAPNLLPGFNGIETNFIADVRQWFTRENVYALEEKGGFKQSRDRAQDAYSMRVRFAKTMMILHLSGWSVGTYKKAHRHGPGFTIVILDGAGFSFMWEAGKPRERIDWHAWSMFVPPAMWYHEHFNTSVEPVRFLAFHPPGMLAYPGWSGEGEHFIGKGPNQMSTTTKIRKFAQPSRPSWRRTA